MKRPDTLPYTPLDIAESKEDVETLLTRVADYEIPGFAADSSINYWDLSATIAGIGLVPTDPYISVFLADYGAGDRLRHKFGLLLHKDGLHWDKPSDGILS